MVPLKKGKVKNMSTATLEREVKSYPLNEKHNFDPKLYQACVNYAKKLNNEQLEKQVDFLLEEILKYPDVNDDVKEQTAIFSFLSRRRKN